MKNILSVIAIPPVLMALFIPAAVLFPLFLIGSAVYGILKTGREVS